MTLGFLCFSFGRWFYSSQESAKYKMPEWFISVGQVGLIEEKMVFPHKVFALNFAYLLLAMQVRLGPSISARVKRFVSSKSENVSSIL